MSGSRNRSMKFRQRGGVLDVPVTSSMDYGVRSLGASAWVEVGNVGVSGGGSFSFRVQPNEDLERSREAYSLEKFLEYDEVNRRYYDSLSATRAVQPAVDEAEIRTAPPTVYRSYRDMMKR